MKKFVEDFNKVRDKIARLPDEEMANIAQRMKINHPAFSNLVCSLIQDDGRSNNDSFEFVNMVRRTKTYRHYPKSMTDEDRLTMTLFKYVELSGVEWNSIGEEEPSQVLKRMINEDSDQECFQDK
jgi:hypothetical protein